MNLLNANRCAVGEGPLWDDRREILLFVDILGKCIFKADINTGNAERVEVGQMVGCMALCENGDLLLGMEDGVYRLTDGGSLTLAHQPINIKGTRFNDGKVGPDGCFYLGTTDPDGKGAFYRLCDGVLTELFDGCGCSNGLDWTRDGKKMFYCDTPRKMIEIFDFDAQSHTLENRRKFVDIPAALGCPDGFCTDENDSIWLGLWDGGAVLHINCDGSFEKKLEVPAKKASCCAFAGADLDELIITTAAKSDVEEFPLAGYVFSEKMNVKGKIPFRYKG